MSLPKQTPAPSDADSVKAYNRLVEEANRLGLLVQEWMGTATISTPETQRRYGVRQSTLDKAGLHEEPKP